MIDKTLFFEQSFSKAETEFIEKAFGTMLTERQTGRVGYYDLPISQDALVEKIYDFIATNEYLRQNRIRDLVVIGIGGSSLGTRAIDDLLKFSKNRNILNVHFLENCDPIYLINSIKAINLEKSFFVVISKSGTTIETISIAKYLLEMSKEPLESEQFRKKVAIITDEGSALDRFGAEYGLSVFHIPSNVGGRFSVLSAVGLLPLAILGYKIEDFLKGAKMIMEAFFEDGIGSDLFKKAYFYYRHRKTRNINILFSYSSLFDSFNKWYIQLWAESLGKISRGGERVGLTPIGLIGSVDQHSFLQLIVEGPRDKTVTFLKLRNFELPAVIPEISLKHLEKTDFVNGRHFQTLINSQCDATLESVVEAGVCVDLLELESLSEESVGYLVYYFELLTSAMGAMLDIDTYNQPGVEIGKRKLATKLGKS